MICRLLCLLLICTSGCGTYYNLREDGPPSFHASFSPYGGVFNDTFYGGVAQAGAVVMACDGKPLESLCMFGMGWYALLIDLPLSFVADTVTLPYVLIHEPDYEKNRRQPAPEVSNEYPSSLSIPGVDGPPSPVYQSHATSPFSPIRIKLASTP